MNIKVESVTFTRGLSGPDRLNFDLVGPTGAKFDMILELPEGVAAKWLVENLGKGVEYRYVEHKSGDKQLNTVDEIRRTGD
jgi:hypothetical protein